MPWPVVWLVLLVSAPQAAWEQGLRALGRPAHSIKDISIDDPNQEALIGSTGIHVRDGTWRGSSTGGDGRMDTDAGVSWVAFAVARLNRLGCIAGTSPACIRIAAFSWDFRSCRPTKRHRE